MAAIIERFAPLSNRLNALGEKHKLLFKPLGPIWDSIKRFGESTESKQRRKIQQSFDTKLQEMVDAQAKTADPVARYAGLGKLDAAFDQAISDAQAAEEKRQRAAVKRDLWWTLAPVSVMSVGLAGFSVFAFAMAGAAAIPVVTLSAILAIAMPFAAACDIREKPAKAAAELGELLAPRAEYFRSVTAGLRAEIEDRHLPSLASSPLTDDPHVRTPRLHRKLSDLYRAAAQAGTSAEPQEKPVAPPASVLRL